MTTMRHSSTSLCRYGVVTLLASLSGLPTVAAECFEDGFGNQRCRLSNGARIGIAVALIVAGILLILAAILVRRRRVRHINQAYVTAAQQQQAQYPYGNGQYGSGAYGYPVYDPTNQQSYPQHYPPPPPQNYYENQQGGYAPPPGPPPNVNYETPANPPAAATKA